MAIFTINDSELKVDAERGIERNREWACLPAVEWGDDKAVNNVLPMRTNLNAWGWFEVKDGWLRQMLRDPYDREPYTMDVYLLQNSDYYALGRILNVDAVTATFHIEQFATRQTVEAIRGLVSHKDDYFKEAVRIAHDLEQKGSCHFAFSYYSLHIEDREVHWDRLAQLVNHLPHGNGWNGIWYISVRNDTRYDISIEYDASEGIDDSEVYAVGWDLSFAAGEWKVNDFRGDWYGEEEVDFNFQQFTEGLVHTVEEALNAI